VRLPYALAIVGLCVGCCGKHDIEGLVQAPTGAVFVRSRGEGPHLVLLHGLSDSSPIDGVGHAAQLEAPAEVLADVLDFLRA